MFLDIKEVQQVANAMMNVLHEEEIHIVNEFYDAAAANDIAKTDELFKVVLFDVEDHFTTEEEMMEQSQFYAMQMHKSEHDTMRQKIKDLHAHWEKFKDPKEVTTFLEEEFKKWIVLHVARWDSETAMHVGDTM